MRPDQVKKTRINDLFDGKGRSRFPRDSWFWALIEYQYYVNELGDRTDRIAAAALALRVINFGRTNTIDDTTIRYWPITVPEFLPTWQRPNELDLVYEFGSWKTCRDLLSEVPEDQAVRMICLSGAEINRILDITSTKG